METKQAGEPICKSVFKSGKSTTTNRQFTQVYIELINRMERNKSAALTAKK